MKMQINNEVLEAKTKDKEKWEQSLLTFTKEASYWQNTPYNIAVETEIRKKYSLSDELAIQRQEKAKPEEFQQYYDYCEQCKAYVKEKRKIYGGN